MAYHIGTPGQPWGAAEKAQWLSERKVQRSYADEVLKKVDLLKQRFDVQQYGALSIDEERYPLMSVCSKGWSPDKPTVLVTGGVHGYETSGVQGALRFLDASAESYAAHFNICVAPCVSPWGYECIERWNPKAIDPNRSFGPRGVAGSLQAQADEAALLHGALAKGEARAEEAEALMRHLDSLGVDKWVCHLDLHETTDTDLSEFRPARFARDGKPAVKDTIPDGFYLVGDADHRKPAFLDAIIAAVGKVTHIAPPDADGKIIGDPVDPASPGVILVPCQPLGLCAGVVGATYAATTEVYPDSPSASDEECALAQVAAVTAALDYVRAQTFIDAVNGEYEILHRAFEEQFWGTKMALAAPSFSVAELTRTKGEMEAMLSDKVRLETTRALLTGGGGLTAEQAMTLRIFERTFGCYIMESPAALEMRERCTKIEGELEDARNKMKLGATIGGDFVELSSVGLRSKMRVDADEAVRQACWEEGLRSIGGFVTSHGFVELVKARNAMAKELGYEDFYDYKVTQAEGFGKARLFEILDTLEQGTRPLMVEAQERLVAEKGAAALKPWNTGFMMAGSITKRLDPYFPFERAVEQWGRSYAALQITYEGAEMTLDLLDRKGKYSNGFCHWPQPAWVKPDGTWQPSQTNFTSLADPSAIGSGHTALTTLMHEAGHAAHFANIKMPSPLFSQERAPTSVAYAELQSMFLDALVGDAAWRGKYAVSREGEALPWALHEEDVRAKHPYEVLALRGMLSVPYFEKALYEMDESQLSAASIKALADSVEERVQGGLGPRPLLSVPHILSDEASCYYHGYVLAEMAVHHTRAFLMERDGYIVDNPKVGPTLREAYWKPGNSEMFLDLVARLTGTPLSGDAWVDMLKEDVEELLAKEKPAYEEAIAAAAKAGGGNRRKVAPIDLNMRIKIIDGDDVLADTQADGGFLETCAKFERLIRKRFPRVEQGA